MPRKSKYDLILLNDDYNTYEYVCHCLESIMILSSLQAGQIASITHEKGSCKLRTGDKAVLGNLAFFLKDKGLNVEIKVVNSK
jgi:ATP-dependent Clp protease adapter protein ClpS